MQGAWYTNETEHGRCGPNIQDDMSTLVLELMPERWKIFQVLPVEGQNDGDVDSLLIEKDEFENGCRHKHVESRGIQFVPESNDLMRGSYAMLDALGRFYSNESGGHVIPFHFGGRCTKAWEKTNLLSRDFMIEVDI